MKTGPKTKPTAIKRLQGNPGGRPLPENEPDVHGRPICPSWLNDYAKTEWRYVVPLLADMGVIGKVDRAAIVNYCLCYAKVRELTELLDAEMNRLVISTHNGTKIQNPALGALSTWIKNLDRAAAKLGITPSDRTNISVPEREQADEIDRLMQRAKQRVG